MVKSMMSTMATALVAADDLGLLQAARTTIASPTTTDSEDEAHVLLLQASTQQSRGKVAGSASPTVERALVATASWRALTGQRHGLLLVRAKMVPLISMHRFDLCCLVR